MASPSKNAEQIAKLLEDIDIAMLTTVGDAGYLVSRPLSTQRARFDGERVWFFIASDSPKIAEIRRHPKVNLAYASRDRNTYVSIAGDARISRDRRRINELWNDALKAYFPGGKDDPTLALLEVRVRTAEYWDGPGSLIGKVITFVVARITGREEVMGENRIVDLTGARTTTRLPPSHEDARPSRKPSPRKGPPRIAAKPPAPKATRKPAAKPRKSGARKAAARKPAARKSAGGGAKRVARSTPKRKTATRRR